MPWDNRQKHRWFPVVWCDWARWCHFQRLPHQRRREHGQDFVLCFCPCCPCCEGSGGHPRTRELPPHLTSTREDQEIQRDSGRRCGRHIRGSWKAESLPLTDEKRGPTDREVPAASHIVRPLIAHAWSLCRLVQWFKPARCFPSLVFSHKLFFRAMIMRHLL